MMSFKEVKETIFQTFKEFWHERPLLHGAALSYYALMALIPLLYLSITYVGQFLGQEMMADIITSMLHDYIGLDDVSGIIEFLHQVDLESSNMAFEIIGVLALLFSCTAIMNSLKMSLNDFYDIDKKLLERKTKIVRGLLFRFISMLVIAGVTVMIIALYFTETVFLSFSESFLEDRELLSWMFSSAVRHGIPIVMNVLMFTFIFKYLNNGLVHWRIAIRGGINTGVFLYLGQLLIKFYLLNYFFMASAGVSGALLVILVWVYYSAIILFLGAKFTAVYAKRTNRPIQLRD